MTTEIQFVVPGQPIGKGRARAARRGKFITMYTPAKTVNYESLVALVAHAAMAGRSLIIGPVSMDIEINLQIPESWSKKKKQQAADGFVAATKKPDCSNILKAVEDGMNGVVYKDDVQIIKSSQSKRYAETPGVIVIVRELDLQVA